MKKVLVLGMIFLMGLLAINSYAQEEHKRHIFFILSGEQVFDKAHTDPEQGKFAGINLGTLFTSGNGRFFGEANFTFYVDYPTEFSIRFNRMILGGSYSEKNFTEKGFFGLYGGIGIYHGTKEDYEASPEDFISFHLGFKMVLALIHFDTRLNLSPDLPVINPSCWEFIKPYFTVSLGFIF